MTRHNLGYLVIDQLAGDHSIGITLKGFDALYGKGQIGTDPVLLVKPQTFMNRSGFAVRKLFDYFRIPDPEDLIIIHDDLDLPLGVIRLRANGGHGGHKGVLSTVEQLGNPQFLRVRLGIGRPMVKIQTEDYVLGRFSQDDMKHLPKLVTMAASAVTDMISSGMQTAMNKYNGNTINNFFD